METIVRIVAEIKRVIESDEAKEKYRTIANAWTRDRQLHISDVVLYVLSLIKTIQICEIMRYFKAIKEKAVAPSSMTRARKKLSFKIFEDLLYLTVKNTPTKETYHGYRIVAIDGMQGELPRTKELLEKYPPHGDSRIPKFHAIAAYDALNKIFLDAEVYPAPTDEREAAIALLGRMELGSHDIVTADRGFPSLKMIKFLDDHKIQYAIRISKSFTRETDEFYASDKTDEIIKIDYTKRRAATSRVDCEVPHLFTFRAVKIPLGGGNFEVLLTSLFDFDIAELSKLYSFRWCIETGYNYLKNVANIESFVGKIENLILQEFYASLIIYNLANILCLSSEVDEILYKKP